MLQIQQQEKTLTGMVFYDIKPVDVYSSPNQMQRDVVEGPQPS